MVIAHTALSLLAIKIKSTPFQLILSLSLSLSLSHAFKHKDSFLYSTDHKGKATWRR